MLLSRMVVFFILVFFGQSLPTWANPKVVHLAQNHGSFTDEVMTALIAGNRPYLFNVKTFFDDFREVYQSQQIIYDWLETHLKENPNLWVFDENRWVAPTEQECQPIRERMQQFSLKDPTAIQMLVLVQEGPARVLYCSGTLRNYHPGDDQYLYQLARSNRGMDYITKNYDSHQVFGDREKWVVNQVKGKIEPESAQEAAIIFGAAHDFKKYFVPGTDSILSPVDYIRHELVPAQKDAGRDLKLFNWLSSLEDDLSELPRSDVPFSDELAERMHGIRSFRELESKIDVSIGEFLLKGCQAEYELTSKLIEKVNQCALRPITESTEKNTFDYMQMFYLVGTLSIEELQKLERNYHTRSAAAQGDFNRFMNAALEKYAPNYFWNVQTQQVEKVKR